MKIRILGGGWYGCHLALALRKEHELVLYESNSSLFSGASGNMPGRLHLGFHYPRSKLTRAACQDHNAKFMKLYGHLTRGVPLNIYAIAKDMSYVDFGNYCQSLKDEVEFVRIDRPQELGLYGVEGALLTGERHTVVREARKWFSEQLADYVVYNYSVNEAAERTTTKFYDLTVDCTFCARDNLGVDRYEPCVTFLLEGPTDKAVTIMDGPFPSLYPWDEDARLCSLSSALLTPLSKAIHDYAEAQDTLKSITPKALETLGKAMVAQMEHFFPEVTRSYSIVGQRLAVRAMPLSGADARLVDVVKIGERTLRIRASKLDAIFYAEDIVREHIRCL